MTKSYVRTATRTTLKVEANLTQILNFKANFHTEFELFFPRLAPMWQQSGTLLFCSCHGIAGFLVDELQI